MRQLKRNHPVVFWLLMHVVVFIVIFFTLGFVGGLHDNNKPEQLEVMARRDNFKAFLVNKRQVMVIEYVCKNESIFRWDVDSNNLFQRISFIDLEYSFQDQAHIPYKLSKELIVPFLGGGAGAWTIKDMLASPRGHLRVPAKVKGGVTRILSGLSGYYLGYVVASMFWDCKSKDIISSLESKEKWHDIERAMFFSRWREEYERIDWSAHKIIQDYWHAIFKTLAEKALIDIRTSYLKSFNVLKIAVHRELKTFFFPAGRDTIQESQDAKRKRKDPDRLVELLIEAIETEQDRRKKEVVEKKGRSEEFFGSEWQKRQ